MDRETSAYLAVLVTVTIWGTATAVIKLLQADLHSYLLMFYVAAFAVLGNLVLVVATGRTERFLSYGWRDLAVFAFMSFLGNYLYCVLYYGALDVGPVVVISLVQYLWPIMTVVWTFFLMGEVPGPRAVTCLMLSLAGVAIIATGGDLEAISVQRLEGPFLAAAAAASYGLFSAIGKRRDDDKVSSMAWCFIFYLLFTSVTVHLRVPGGFTIPGARAFIGLAWMGIAGYAIGYMLWLYALSAGDTAAISNMAFLTPFISLFFIRMLLDEPITPSALAGLAVIVLGILVTRSSPVRIPAVVSSRMPSPLHVKAAVSSGLET